MANRYLDKAVYIRETTDGKTKWVKIPGIKIMNSYSVIHVYLDPQKFDERKDASWTGDVVFEQKGRAE